MLGAFRPFSAFISSLFVLVFWKRTDTDKTKEMEQSHRKSLEALKPIVRARTTTAQRKTLQQPVPSLRVFTCEEFGDGLVLAPCGADEQQPGRQELVVAGQELGDGPGGAGGRPLLALAQLTAFVDGVHEQEEALLRRLHTQERKQDAPTGRRETLLCLHFTDCTRQTKQITSVLLRGAAMAFSLSINLSVICIFFELADDSFTLCQKREKNDFTDKPATLGCRK